MKFNNRTLLIVFVALAAAFFITRYFFSGRQTSNLDMDIVKLDTADAEVVYLYPKAASFKEIKFIRTGDGWMMQFEGKEMKSQEGAVPGLLSALAEIKPERLASRSPEKWESFELTDSTATRVKVMDKKGKALTDILIGKFSFRQNPQANQFGGGSGGKGTSYVRLNGEKEVFAVDGFLTFSFNRDFNSFRNQQFLETSKEQLTRITWQYPEQGSFMAEKRADGWYLGEVKADSSAFDTYLNSISMLSNNQFADDYSPAFPAAIKVTFESGPDTEPVVLSVWETENPEEFHFKSSLNPESYFRSAKASQYGQVLKRMEDFQAVP